ncbi:ion channel [Agarivorans sp. MS3-6]|uniref:ion channel n=1 Tax=Agarivorans sp. TSD2052 TaxID=2937286 RepID=UPI00200C3AAE|nr:ion channel [Agarivorans sp. TSD2052]UPW17684.1 ion channel [Agarivorans sp. TSD2052]
MLLYVLISYFSLLLVGEHALVNSETFLYWMVVTASTVGYGDFGPSTPLGRLIVSLWVIPVGISIFAIVITKAGFIINDIYTKGTRGHRMLKLTNHTVIIGWNGARTLRLIELLTAATNGSSDSVLLCVDSDIENPLPGKVEFAQVDSYSHAETMARTNITDASRIIIDTDQDDVTLTSALYCAKLNPSCHKTAYLQDQTIADLLRSHCPKVEVIPSVSVEMLARSAMDPGSAQVHQQLLDTTHGMTQYSVQYLALEPIKFADAFHHFKTDLQATIIGLKVLGDAQLQLNPSLDSQLNQGDSLYYIAERRLTDDECFNFKTIG